MQYDFGIKYKKERESTIADSLSRLYVKELAAILVSNIGASLFQNIVESLDNDQEIQVLLKETQDQTGECEGYSFINRQLRKDGKLVVGNNSELK